MSKSQVLCPNFAPCKHLIRPAIHFSRSLKVNFYLRWLGRYCSFSKESFSAGFVAMVALYIVCTKQDFSTIQVNLHNPRFPELVFQMTELMGSTIRTPMLNAEPSQTAFYFTTLLPHKNCSSDTRSSGWANKQVPNNESRQTQAFRFQTS